ncbi:hypothetical protein Tco_1069422 [Tanacetum coccineum]|uniref:Uncharacterized protein n=1 Tax=Tanacetum coccineum TaxID=301880 RepID=A0ABQ5HKC9_9ASTR
MWDTPTITGICTRPRSISWQGTPPTLHLTNIEELTVLREDDRKYMYKEADFQNMNLNDNEDLYRIRIQQNQNFPIDTFLHIDYYTPLNQFTRTLVLKTRVSDFEMGIEGYQHKLNLTKPLITLPDIEDLKQGTLFGTSTLARVNKLIKEKLIEKRFGFVTLPLSNEQQNDYERILKAVEKRIKFREQMKRIEGFLNLRDQIRGKALKERPT